MEPDVFNNLHAIPDPEPRTDDSSRFKCFSDLYGQTTTQSFCPSLRQMLFTSPDGENRPLPDVRMTQETVRDYVLCVDCAKPRCIYSNKKLSAIDKAAVNVLKEEVIYTCGGVMIPDDHPLSDTVVVQPNSTCLSPVVSHYYSHRAGFPVVCFNSGSDNLHHIPNEMKQQYQSEHPVCIECKEKNTNERTRGAKT